MCPNLTEDLTKTHDEVAPGVVSASHAKAMSVSVHTGRGRLKHLNHALVGEAGYKHRSSQFPSKGGGSNPGNTASSSSSEE
jgi:hypothetical protein